MLFESTSPLARLGELANDEQGISHVIAAIMMAGIIVGLVLVVFAIVGVAVENKAIEVAGDINGAGW